MTRKKVKLAFISNDSSRKATFKKRKKGLMKKVKELSTLCGITACAIIYSPYDTSPEVWPSSSGVQRVIQEFRTLPEMDQHKKMVDQEAFLKQRIAKATENLRRQRKDNRELEMTEVMFQCLIGNMGMFHLNIVDLNDLGYLIEQFLKDVSRRIEIMQSSGVEIGQSSSTVAAASEGNTTTPATTIYEVGSSSSAAVADLFNPIQQPQYGHSAAPQIRAYEQLRNLNLNLNHNHNQNQQQWYMEMVNHPEQMRHPAEHMRFPFMDDNRHNHNHIHHHQEEQQHQIHHHQEEQQHHIHHHQEEQQHHIHHHQEEQQHHIHHHQEEQQHHIHHHQEEQQHHIHHHQEEQQHHIHGESSTALDATTSSSIVPVTSPNTTNNFWFR